MVEISKLQCRIIVALHKTIHLAHTYISRKSAKNPLTRQSVFRSFMPENEIATMTDIFKYQKSKAFRERLQSRNYLPRHAEDFVSQTPDLLRQRRNSELSFATAFGELTNTDRWKYSLVDMTGLWLLDCMIELEEVSLRHAIAFAAAAAPSVTAAIAVPDSVNQETRLGLIGPLKNDNGHLFYNAIAKRALDNFLALPEPRTAGIRILYLAEYVSEAPQRLVDEIKNVLLES